MAKDEGIAELLRDVIVKGGTVKETPCAWQTNRDRQAPYDQSECQYWLIRKAHAELNVELEKLRVAIEAAADAVMDLNTGEPMKQI